MTAQRRQMALATFAERRRVDEELVRNVPQPKFTDTWHPFSHATVIDSVAAATTKLGLDVGRKMYSLDKTGANMFGLWEISGGAKAEGKVPCVGFRNSVNKKMTVGFCGIFTVVFCTNQISQSKFFQLRMHTAMLTVVELGTLAEAAVQKVVAQLDDLNTWHEKLRDWRLTPTAAERLTVLAMRREILAPKKFGEFDEIFFGGPGRTPAYDQTLYGFHGALTQIIREHSLHIISEENARIARFVDEAKGLLGSGGLDAPSGEVIEAEGVVS